MSWLDALVAFLGRLLQGAPSVARGERQRLDEMAPRESTAADDDAAMRAEVERRRAAEQFNDHTRPTAPAPPGDIYED